MMGKTEVSEKDRPDLERLEQIVKDAGHPQTSGFTSRQRRT